MLNVSRIFFLLCFVKCLCATKYTYTLMQRLKTYAEYSWDYALFQPHAPVTRLLVQQNPTSKHPSQLESDTSNGQGR